MSAIWSAYEYQPSFILGFHGCDQSVGEKILSGEEAHLKHSEQKFDWLGHGVYFWEGNPSRAMEWAVHRKQDGKIKTPFVLGAIIDLRHCIDLFDYDGLVQVKEAHRIYMQLSEAAGTEVAKNVGASPDRAGRALDCAVMNTLHTYRESRQAPAYDSVRGPFLEGDPIYPEAGFLTKNHIQLCVRNTDCIKGYFRPLHGKVADA